MRGVNYAKKRWNRSNGTRKHDWKKNGIRQRSRNGKKRRSLQQHEKKMLQRIWKRYVTKG